MGQRTRPLLVSILTVIIAGSVWGGGGFTLDASRPEIREVRSAHWIRYTVDIDVSYSFVVRTRESYTITTYEDGVPIHSKTVPSKSSILRPSDHQPDERVPEDSVVIQSAQTVNAPVDGTDPETLPPAPLAGSADDPVDGLPPTGEGAGAAGLDELERNEGDTQSSGDKPGGRRLDHG